jgi:transketolase
MTVVERDVYLVRKGILGLLAIKDADIRITTLEQCRDAVDRTIHVGGAFSATIPLVSLFYGGFIDLDVENPTRRGQDMFVLSKGHAVASMASIYADLGYFDRSVLVNSRSVESILNGHPGPILPGVHISTGPLGQGLAVAEGFALVGKRAPHFDVFCMTGDGELHEGTIWEAVMYSGYRKLDNLCVLVDSNRGQLDNTRQLLLPLNNLVRMFDSFGWKVVEVDATQYDPVYEALYAFRYAPRDGRPTAIICQSTKGHGGFSDAMNRHKAVVAEDLMAQELALQGSRRSERVSEFIHYFNGLDRGAVRDDLAEVARRMNIELFSDGSDVERIEPILGPVRTRKAPPRAKRIVYSANDLPTLDQSKEYSAGQVVQACMNVLARDPRVVSIDADLASTSGLQDGIGYVDVERALNVGVAEANMMGIGEAYAVMGYNTWVSTFCPFFDWKVLRRIAIGHQERLEAMAEDGWLSDGHGLDLTFLATAPNFETKTNGATHMGNDDVTVYDGVAHLKIVDISCPQQLIGAIEWIAAGNRGLVYMRIMRAASGVLYEPDFEFSYGKGHVLKQSQGDQAYIVSSGRGVHEALAAAEALEASGLRVGVVDMPSIDEALLLKLYDSGKPVIIAEQNNGRIYRHCLKVLFRHRERIDTGRVVAINTLDEHGEAQFIHSGTYPELLNKYGLSPEQLVQAVRDRLGV